MLDQVALDQINRDEFVKSGGLFIRRDLVDERGGWGDTSD
jgi:hypothetical protein